MERGRYLWQMPHTCHARWERAHHRLGPYAAFVAIGTLGSDGWYVDVVAPPPMPTEPPEVVGSEQEARQRAGWWMRRIGGGWELIECSPTVGWRAGEREDQPETGSHE